MQKVKSEQLLSYRSRKKNKMNVHTTRSGLIRENDGRLDNKINALIQKCKANCHQTITYKNTNITYIRNTEIIGDINENTNDDSQIYLDVQSDTMSSQSTFYPQMENTCNERDTHSNYHLDSMRQQKHHSLYVQVSKESELSLNCLLYGSKNCKPARRYSAYAFKNKMHTNMPPLQVATITCTNSVFSTATVITPMEHPSPHGTDVSFETEGLTDSLTSVDTLLELDSPAITSKMLEDAMELVGLNRNWKEQTGMGVSVCCVLCFWAGPNKLLQNHILKEHSSAVVDTCDGALCVSWSLGALASGARSYVMRHTSSLYVLRAHYRGPEHLFAHLASISADSFPKIGDITIYNKESGQPYYWGGLIQPLNGEDLEGLEVDISHLDLLPNSANSANRELVSDSQTKVIFGAPALDDINIDMHIKIL